MSPIVLERINAAFSKVQIDNVDPAVLCYYPQLAALAGGIVRDWQSFGHVSDFPIWSEVGTKCEAKPPNFGGNFEPSYLPTGKSF